MRYAFFKMAVTCSLMTLMLQVATVCSPVVVKAQTDCESATENLREVRANLPTSNDMEDSLQRLKNITDTCPNFADAWYFRGMVEKRLGKPSDYSIGKAQKLKSSALANNIDPFTGSTANDNPVRPSPSSKKESNKPKIEIHYPKATRGQSAQIKTCNVTVKGQAIDESAIREVVVHGIQADVDGQGNFSVSLNLKPGDNSIMVMATDIHDNTGQERFTIACENLPAPVVAANTPTPSSSSPTLSLPPSLMAAKQYALVIGINDYQTLPKLGTAVNDANDVARVLREEFGFEIKLLLNADATREKIIEALEGYEKSLKAGDRLLIYYAGHGYKDTTVNKAYWNPVNATTSRSSWISADDVTTNLFGIHQAQQILVVSDSCYSGEMGRSPTDIRPTASSSTPTERNNFLEKTAKYKSRILIASGGNEPVADGGGGNHSIFAAKFLLGLREMNLKAFTANELFNNYIGVSVGGNSDQLPSHNKLLPAGHESGDFIFVRRQ